MTMATEGRLPEIFRENLRSLRKAKGWTQVDLAKAAGLHQPYIAALENGRRTPQLDTLETLADALGVSPTRLIDEEIFAESA